MKKIVLIFYTIVSLIIESENPHVGKYKRLEQHHYEELELHEDYTFKYRVSSGIAFNYSNNGYYHVRKDTLFLDSYPQKETLIVHEDFKGKYENKTFVIKDRFEFTVAYCLHLYLKNGQEIDLKDQRENTKLKNVEIDSFYIYSAGFKSRTYSIIGGNTNYFTLVVDMKKVFEHEKWLINGDKIYTRDFDGKLSNAYLEKVTD
uniref:hypothetical protein n=1 Tax=Flavobacterium sp. TaxID=239 RepID=UPI00404A67BE